MDAQERERERERPQILSQYANESHQMSELF